MCDFRVFIILGAVHTVSGYSRIRNFSFPDTITHYTHPAKSTANLDIFKSALQKGKKYIPNESDNVWMGESGYFRF